MFNEYDTTQSTCPECGVDMKEGKISCTLAYQFESLDLVTFNQCNKCKAVWIEHEAYWTEDENEED